jgi:predicted lipid-binding transport protein (Tim44 family)
MRWAQTAARLAALTALLLIGVDESDARPVDGMMRGDGASNIFISSPALSVVTSSNGAGVLAPRMRAQAVPPYQSGSLSGLFSRGGMLGGFAAGFLGSGLFGLLFGRGLTSELGGVPSYLGLIFQVALLAMLVWLIWTRWRSDDALSPAGLSPRQLADPYLRTRDDLHALIDPSVDDQAEEALASSSARASKVAESRGGA